MGRAFSEAYKRYALGVMTTVYMLNLVDRGLMTLLLQPIKEDLHLSDSQLGFVTGIAFGLFYATLGLPIARWADRGNRVTITSLAIGLWGLTVMACVLVGNYVQLVCARIAAAIGEAGCKPPTYSLVGDYFPAPAERTRAMAIYLAGNSVSALLTFIVGGWLNELYGWRMTFFIMGIPGLLMAIVVRLTLVEPRAHAAPTGGADNSRVPMGEVLRVLWRRRSCRNLGVALVLLYTMGLGLAPWYGAFLIRNHGMSTSELGVWLGVLWGIGGMAGILLGGFVATRFFPDDERGQARLSALSVAAVVPCFVAFLTLPLKSQALMALVPLIVVYSLFLGPTYALLQRLVPDEMRASMLATVMLLANLMGMGLGPQLVGLASDALQPVFGRDALRYSMLLTSFIALWSAVHFWRAGTTIREDLIDAQRPAPERALRGS